MPLIEMTEELIKIVKDERAKSKMSGETLASAIKKNRAFVSQLENGKIPLIDLEILHNILKVITKQSEDDFNVYIEELLRKILPHYSSDSIKKDEWMVIFDLQFREFSITDTIIDFITTKCTNLKISFEQLVGEINKNKDLEYSTIYEPNKLNVIFQNDSLGTVIRFSLKEDYIKNICSKRISKINYINLLGIIYNLFILENEDANNATILAEQFLESNDIITIVQRDIKKRENLKKILDAGEEDKYEFNEVTKNDTEYAKAYKKTEFWFRNLYDAKPDEAFKYLNDLNKNFESDWKLMFAIMGSPIFNLKALSFNVKKDFFNDYKELLKKYADKAKDIKPKEEEYI